MRLKTAKSSVSGVAFLSVSVAVCVVNVRKAPATSPALNRQRLKVLLEVLHRAVSRGQTPLNSFFFTQI
jgi:predicted nucleic acid-binding Zn ribbon protein